VVVPNSIAFNRPGPSSRLTFRKAKNGISATNKITATQTTPARPPPPIAGMLAAKKFYLDQRRQPTCWAGWSMKLRFGQQRSVCEGSPQAAETTKNQPSRDFRSRSIFDFFNSIDPGGHSLMYAAEIPATYGCENRSALFLAGPPVDWPSVGQSLCIASAFPVRREKCAPSAE
jgi:hypothetical protein